jgi:hypothetical protein
MCRVDHGVVDNHAARPRRVADSGSGTQAVTDSLENRDGVGSRPTVSAEPGLDGVGADHGD